MNNPPELPVMIFAAGLGTRMGALTRDRPKPLVKVAGRALLDHALDITRESPASRQVLNLHYKAEMIREHLAGQDVLYSDETTRLLETGGGLRKAADLLGTESVFTLNSDAVWKGDNPLSTLFAHWDNHKMDALLLLVPRENALGHTGQGDFVIAPDGRLTREPGLVYSGAQIIKPALLGEFSQPVFSLNMLWDKLEKEGRLYGLIYSGQWCDVGQPESIRLAEEMINANDV